MTTYYEKRGRRYVPVMEAVTHWGLPEGSYLVQVTPGSTTTKYHVNPDYAAVEAALMTLEDAMVEAMLQESKLRPSSVPMSAEEIAAWEVFRTVLHGREIVMYSPSIHNVVQAGINVLRDKLEEPPCQ